MDASVECEARVEEAGVDHGDILNAMEVVERDSIAISQSLNSIFASLRLALSEVTESSVEHMHLFTDAAGHIQEASLDAATRGNQIIKSCLRLNKEIKGIESMGVQIKALRRYVDALDSRVEDVLMCC